MNASSFQSVLVGLEGTVESPWAVDVALRLCEPESTRFHLVGVVELPPASDAGAIELYAQAEQLERVVSLQLEWASSRLTQAGASPLPVLCRGSAKEAIVKLTRELGPELVVLGAPRHAFWECGLRGCTACWVTKHVPCTVVVVRNEPARA